MPPDNRDVERFKRIRDQQISARDPLIKQRKLDRSIAEKHRRSRRRFSFGQMWVELPHKWRNMLVAGLIGIAVAVLLPSFVPGTWGVCFGLVGFAFITALGFFVGRYEDAREEVQELMKH